MDVQTTWVDLPADSGRMAAFIAEPSTSGSYPGIAHFHVVLGITEDHKRIATRLAAEGYVVALADYYHRVGYRLSYQFPSEIAQAREARESLTYYGLAADSRIVLNFLREHSKVDPNRLGVIGYCSGATMALLAASFHQDIRAVAAMYPTDLFPTSFTPGRPIPPMQLAPNIQAPVLMISGNADRNPSPVDVRAAAAIMERLNKSFEYHIYDGDPPAGHAFFDEDLPMGHRDAVEWAWPIKLDFFRQCLGSKVGQLV